MGPWRCRMRAALIGRGCALEKEYKKASVCENRWTITEMMNRNLQWDEEKLIFFPSCTEFGSRLQLRLMFYCFVSNDVRQDTFKITCTTQSSSSSSSISVRTGRQTLDRQCFTTGSVGWWQYFFYGSECFIQNYFWFQSQCFCGGFMLGLLGWGSIETPFGPARSTKTLNALKFKGSVHPK